MQYLHSNAWSIYPLTSQYSLLKCNGATRHILKYSKAQSHRWSLCWCCLWSPHHVNCSVQRFMKLLLADSSGGMKALSWLLFPPSLWVSKIAQWSPTKFGVLMCAKKPQAFVQTCLLFKCLILKVKYLTPKTISWLIESAMVWDFLAQGWPNPSWCCTYPAGHLCLYPPCREPLSQALNLPLHKPLFLILNLSSIPLFDPLQKPECTGRLLFDVRWTVAAKCSIIQWLLQGRRHHCIVLVVIYLHAKFSPTQQIEFDEHEAHWRRRSGEKNLHAQKTWKPEWSIPLGRWHKHWNIETGNIVSLVGGTE